MSLDYWNMKLSNTWVYSVRSYHRIVGMRYDDDTDINTNYPEDSLPSITFELDNGNRVKFDDFEIHYPDDQAYLTNDNAFFSNRNLNRHYKIAPTSEIFNVSNSTINNIKSI